MWPSLGFFLRELRQKQRLSQAQTAEAAGIGRATLNRWEMNHHQPRAEDLEVLLGLLSANEREKRQALSLLDTPQKRARTREVIARVGAQKGIGPLPNGGDLLRALRNRRGLSQEDAAKRVGVTVRTLRRWEKAEVWPSPLHIQTLCYVFEARTEEMVALTTSELAPDSQEQVLSVDELKARVQALTHRGGQVPIEALKELHFLTLEAQAWPLAARAPLGRQVLSEIYSHHSHHLSCYNRFGESGLYAHRALDLWPQDRQPDAIRVVAGIASARAAAYGAARRAPKRGLEVLHHWRDAAPGLEYQAWILGDSAKYLAQSGELDAALSLARQAKATATRCAGESEVPNRELDEAQILIWTGQPQQALALLHDNPLTAKAHLLETEAYLGLGNLTLAHERLQSVLNLIAVEELMQLRPRAHKLSEALIAIPESGVRLISCES